MTEKVSPWHIKIAAEAFAAALFARFGFDVSIQYGADQPEYDLIVAQDEKMLKVSVKGSQDGSWGLAQRYIKNADYHAAVDEWLKKHHPKTILCFVQFKNVQKDEIPRMYLATPEEVAERLKATAIGRGDTILYEDHHWGPRAVSAGTRDRIPEEWRFSKERIDELLNMLKSKNNM